VTEIQVDAQGDVADRRSPTELVDHVSASITAAAVGVRLLRGLRS
jgi:hypothetical protein